MSKSYKDYKNVIYVHYNELSGLIMEFDKLDLDYLEDRKECAIYFNAKDYSDELKLTHKVGEWENNVLYE